MSASRVAATVDELGASYLEEFCSAFPFRATTLGLPGHDAEVPDISEATRSGLTQRMSHFRDQLDAFALEELSATDRASRSLLQHNVTTILNGIASRDDDWQIGNLLAGPVYAILSAVPKVTLDSEQRTDDYEMRLSRLGTYIVQSAQALRSGLRDGFVSNKRAIESSLSMLDNYLNAGPSKDPLLQPLAQLLDSRRRGRFEEIVDNSIRPAMARLRATLAEEVLPAARSDDHCGLMYLPEGDEIYTRLVRQHTTTDRTAEDLHATGLAMVQELRAEFSELGSCVFGTQNVDEVKQRLRDDPALRFSSREAMLSQASAAVHRAEEAIPDWFGQRHQAPCEIKSMNDAEAGSSVLGYYHPPAETGSRPGRFWMNTSQPQKSPRHEIETLTFHESVPGHHMQFALAQGLIGLPAYRRFTYVTAYSEGWGLYTECLADEMGLYSEGLARFGMVSFDAWRAARLVVDTGIHALGWSRCQAIDYMWNATALTMDNIVNEVDRYISMPGQALAYMTGRLEIVRLREEAQAMLGARFDIKGFHDAVLGTGSIPLSELAEVVWRWADSRAA
ncbi:DUF885 domain-containing protein [Nesterenkonia ebinurensis]|uniref:DUF885 domain-containing protein n=1 Tax=Nesterenkonia ebinurensis TaxID=2608252 RepID=UPI00123CA352|nr:DUF885 domain-containing protein [Nesterenkonia ebinurensis]